MTVNVRFKDIQTQVAKREMRILVELLKKEYDRVS
jgi:hypothetical protein